MNYSSIFKILTTFLICSLSLVTTAQVDSVLNKALSINNMEERFTALDDLCYFTSYDNPNKAKKYCDIAYKTAQKIGNDSLFGRLYVSLAIHSVKSGDYNKAFEYLNKSLAIRKALGHPREIAGVQTTLAILLSDVGLYDSAATYYFNTLKVFESIKDTNAIAHSYMYLAELFNKANPKRETDYAKKAIAMFKTVGNLPALAQSYEAYATQLSNRDQLDSAIFYHKKALKIHKTGGRMHTIMTSTNNLGYLVRKNGDNQLALAYYKESLETAVLLGDTSSMAHFACNVASVALVLKQPKKALTYFLDANKWAKKNKDLSILQLSSKGIAECYEALGNADLALAYAWETFALRDTIYSKEAIQSMQELETKYETEKKEKQIAQLNQQQAEASLLTAKQQNWIISLIGSILLILAVAGFLIYRRKKRAQQTLTEKELGFRKQLIKNTVNSQEEERKRIAKELHDGIAQSLVAVKMRFQYNILAKQKAGEAQTEEDEKSLELIDSLYNEVRGLSHQMMPLKLTNQGLLSAMEELLNNTLKPVGIQYTFEHNLALDKRLTEHIEVALFRISQELLANILKHSEASEVKIKLQQKHALVHLTVEDNGVGIEQKPQKEVGIGLASIMARVKALNGNVEWTKGGFGGLRAELTVEM